MQQENALITNYQLTKERVSAATTWHILAETCSLFFFLFLFKIHSDVTLAEKGISWSSTQPENQPD